jgi:Ca2+-binding RTX toxin-like protein
MLLTYLGGNSDFTIDAFINNNGDVDVDIVSSSATQIVLQQADTGDITTLTGTGFSFSGDTPTGGTITGMSFSTGGNTTATVTGISWSLTAFDSALDALDVGDATGMAGLFDQSATITIDASGASDGFDASTFENTLSLVTTDITLNGSDFGDTLLGGLGDDTINPGGNSDYDRIVASPGNDVLDVGTNPESDYFELVFSEVTGPVTFDIDGNAGTGSATGSFGTTTIQNLENVVGPNQVGWLGLIGSSSGDTFNINSGTNGWINILPGAGNDTLNINLEGSLRVGFHWDGVNEATNGIVVDLGTGIVSEDGFGGTAQINILGGDARLDIQGTDLNDSVLGSERSDGFIPEQGDDTFNGAGGEDRVRYDRNGVDNLSVDLSAGTATGTWDGNAFTDTLINVEEVRGTRDGDDVLIGDDNENRLRGYGGDDSIVGGLGRDRLYGGDGNDTLDASLGDETTEGWGDYVRPGLGTDTIIGNEALYDDGDGIDISYSDVSGVGGLTFDVAGDGSGTVVSGNAGQVNDTFTFTHYFTGSMDADVFNGDTSSNSRGWIGLGGADTIIAGAGWDNLLYQDDRWEGGTAAILVNFTGEGAGTVVDGFGDTDVFSGIEQVEGTIYDDVMNGGSGEETLRGEEGDDTLNGGGGNDDLRGGDGGDNINGGGGNDRLRSGGDDDDVDGGDGTDTAVFDVASSNVSNVVQKNGGVEFLTDEGSDFFVNVEFFEFTDGTLTFSEVLDLSGQGGIVGDTIIGTSSDDTLTGTANDDVISGGAGSDSLSGGNGDDELAASDGNDVVDGGAGNDLIGGGLGDDTLLGGDGNDIIGSGQGNDDASGDDGNDVVNGGAGHDIISGGNGNDTIGAGFNNDTVEGNAGDDSLGGGTGRDVIDGGSGADAIGAGEGDDTVNGGDGDDFVAGGGRHDVVNGGAGDDRINGGDGDDTMTGGSGADVFIYNFFKEGDADVITDFEDGIDTFRMTGVQGAAGTGLSGKVAALNIVDTAGGAQMTYEGHTILLEGGSASDLGVSDFVFV